MAVIVKTDRQKLQQVLGKASDLAMYALAEQMLADCEKFVPYSGGSSQSAGNLRESGKVVKGEDGSFYLVWDCVYALYQWFGVRADGSHRVTRYTTPGTGKLWVETARGQYGKRWQEIAQKEFTKGVDAAT
ncbi:MAG: hypothetical protein IKF99_09470 [Oscillospiraceae bacterium]|nr:hypothetical protein [Oscillospiraceae bacterium]